MEAKLGRSETSGGGTNAAAEGRDLLVIGLLDEPAGEPLARRTCRNSDDDDDDDDDDDNDDDDEDDDDHSDSREPDDDDDTLNSSLSSSKATIDVAPSCARIDCGREPATIKSASPQSETAGKLVGSELSQTSERALSSIGSCNDQRQQPPLQLRLLVRRREAGALIGKRGANIKRLRETFKSSLFSIPDTGNGPERVVCIASDQDSMESILSDITQLLLEKSPENDEQIELKLLIHSSHAGSIIGIGGQSIRKLRNDSKAAIKIYEMCCPLSSERVCAIKAKPSVVVSTIKLIQSILNENPVKGTSKPYDALNFDLNLVEKYGGYLPSEPTLAGPPGCYELVELKRNFDPMLQFPFHHAQQQHQQQHHHHHQHHPSQHHQYLNQHQQAAAAAAAAANLIRDLAYQTAPTASHYSHNHSHNHNHNYSHSHSHSHNLHHQQPATKITKRYSVWRAPEAGIQQQQKRPDAASQLQHQHQHQESRPSGEPNSSSPQSQLDKAGESKSDELEHSESQQPAALPAELAPRSSFGASRAAARYHPYAPRKMQQFAFQGTAIQQAPSCNSYPAGQAGCGQGQPISFAADGLRAQQPASDFFPSFAHPCQQHVRPCYCAMMATPMVASHHHQTHPTGPSVALSEGCEMQTAVSPSQQQFMTSTTTNQQLLANQPFRHPKTTERKR